MTHSLAPSFESWLNWTDAHLDKCVMAPPKRFKTDAVRLCWFLGPTVALCEQQYNYFCERLQPTRVRLLIGSDNVDRWSEQHVWDTALDHVRLVVSTHKVLEEALAHAFVKLDDLALLIFDEGEF